MCFRGRVGVSVKGGRQQYYAKRLLSYRHNIDSKLRGSDVAIRGMLLMQLHSIRYGDGQWFKLLKFVRGFRQ